ncbi:toxin RelE [Enterobacterales bacterium]|nr:toxin RelE [Enterobacterales bacterium]
MIKNIAWSSTALKDLKNFPSEARIFAGNQLRRIQRGVDPIDFKSVNHWGIGVMELRLVSNDKNFRVIYVAKFEEKIYVLHCFVKKSQATSKQDVTIIKSRYNAILQERRITK